MDPWHLFRLRLTARINGLEAFEVSLLRPSGETKHLAGCLPDDSFQSLRERAALEFSIPRDAVLLCRGSRQFTHRDLQMSLADIGIGAGAELTCLHNALCRRHWRLQIAEEACEWEALVYTIELYDALNNLIPLTGACLGARNGSEVRHRGY